MSRDDTEEAKRAIYRGAVHAALVWGVDRERATHNPVFWHDGALNYVSPSGPFKEVFAFLRQRGIMSAGFNGAHRLNFTFEQLDEALDTDFSRGIDFEAVFGLLLDQFGHWYGFFNFGRNAGPHFLPGTRQWATEVRAVFSHLAELGYLMRMSEPSAEPQYQWTHKASPIVRTHSYIDIDPRDLAPRSD